MRIGIICEGHSDRAVIENLLKGLKGFDSSEFVPIRPQSDFDETDLANLPEDSFGGWDAVKKECERQTKIREFLSIEGQDFVVVQIDSAEAHLFGVNKPTKDSNYSTNLRNAIVQKIDQWLTGISSSLILHAVTIEEMEAWVLTIYENRNSTLSADPKVRLKYVLSRQKINYRHDYTGFKTISNSFSKKKNFRVKNFVANNESLKDFCEEVIEKII